MITGQPVITFSCQQTRQNDNGSSNATVSYTHLDVYKRQMLPKPKNLRSDTAIFWRRSSHSTSSISSLMDSDTGTNCTCLCMAYSSPNAMVAVTVPNCALCFSFKTRAVPCDFAHCALPLLTENGHTAAPESVPLHCGSSESHSRPKRTK